MATSAGPRARDAVALPRDVMGLLVASRLWAARQPVDQARVRAARDELLLANHRRYVAQVPVYRRLATELGLQDAPDVTALVSDLLVSVALFKSYDEAWLIGGDFAALTDWVADVSTLAPAPSLKGVTTVQEWRRRMREEGVYLGISSGSSGRPSFVPRDRATLTALTGNGRTYSPLLWGGYAQGAPDFDLLLLVPPGRALGIEAVATGLSAIAGTSHVLTATGEGEYAGSDGGVEQRLTAATAFVRSVVESHRRLLIFGSPPSVAWLCSALLDRGAGLQLPPDVLLVTGGGWKGSAPQAAGASPVAFSRLVAEVLAIRGEQWVDVYGMTECNAYLLRCPAGRYHVPPVLDAFVLDESLVPLTGPDVTGDIALLDPFAFSYPGFLLTGDTGRLVVDACPCGLAGAGFVGTIQRATGQADKGCAGVVERVQL